MKRRLCSLNYLVQPHLYRPGGEWFFWLISLYGWRSDCLIEIGAPL
jgi:hypothetical protein